ncbi:sensor histidine kinase [Nonomuraea gerenzanensis]|uniref:histidine kinase n=1 Tax=Nonomuraea gerenzanensis TaxID=93944 RepID=A0A1M4EA28_9ACTN|nr:HAMP domain-containing sensor histidine kinase [Nonomuraea gerenzanensis]UBU17821.1 HAMP domain-containing histidine kinase [Nonomuraea gerenzanensis]SBO95604.1 probable two-component sensor kinase [Nonomuraea gerenzanensis]
MKINRPGRLYPQSLRARFALAAGALSLVVLTVVGALAAYGVRNRVAADISEQIHVAVVDWVSRMRPGYLPPPSPAKPSARARYLQLVDSRGRVVAANADAAGKAPLSTVRPAPGRGLQDSTVCPSWSEGECLLVTALRLDPRMPDAPLPDEVHFVYAGTVQPVIVTKYYLEAGFGAAVLIGSLVAAWGTWMVVGRTLRPVQAISTKMREATARDLSIRVPTPPHEDEIAEFAHASNAYLDRLEKTVTAYRRFASMVSHELRSPVTALRTQAEEALMYPREVDTHAALRNTLRSAERLEAIIDDLLAYTRVTHATCEAYQPLNLIALARDEMSALPRDGIPIRLRAVGDPTVRGSRVQLARVLNNLLANARRHARTHVEVTVEQDGRQAVVTVQDDGAGIAAEDRERIFQPFVRLTEGLRLDPGGSGLGLAISRETCQAHGGSLSVEDCPSGARFVVRLPLAAPA